MKWNILVGSLVLGFGLMVLVFWLFRRVTPSRIVTRTPRS